jgi:hypothetical protein
MVVASGAGGSMRGRESDNTTRSHVYSKGDLENGAQSLELDVFERCGSDWDNTHIEAGFVTRVVVDTLQRIRNQESLQTQETLRSLM